MKKLLLILLPVAVILLAVVGFMVNKGFSVSVGRCLVTDNGSCMLIVNNSPIVLSNRTERPLFQDLSTGDEILVVHDGIAESYPAQTGAYFCYKRQEGTLADIPKTVITSLQELGWFSPENE